MGLRLVRRARPGCPGHRPNCMAAYWLLLACGLFLLLGGCVGLGWKIWRDWGKKVYTEEEKDEAIRMKREMEELQELPGWKTLVKYAEVQLSGRKNEVLLKPTENPYQQEYLKGEVNGIDLFIRIPKVIVDESQAVINAVNREADEV